MNMFDSLFGGKFECCRPRFALKSPCKPNSRFDGFLAPIFRQDEPQGYQPAGQLGSLRVSDDGLFDITLDDYVECMEMLAKQIVEARLIGKGKPPINKDDVAQLLRNQEKFVASTSDLPVCHVCVAP